MRKKQINELMYQTNIKFSIDSKNHKSIKHEFEFEF